MNGETIDPIDEVRGIVEEIYDTLNRIDIAIANSTRGRKPLNAKKLGKMADDLITDATTLAELLYEMEVEDERREN